MPPTQVDGGEALPQIVTRDAVGAVASTSNVISCELAAAGPGGASSVQPASPVAWLRTVSVPGSQPSAALTVVDGSAPAFVFHVSCPATGAPSVVVMLTGAAPHV